MYYTRVGNILLYRHAAFTGDIKVRHEMVYYFTMPVIASIRQARDAPPAPASMLAMIRRRHRSGHFSRSAGRHSLCEKHDSCMPIATKLIAKMLMPRRFIRQRISPQQRTCSIGSTPEARRMMADCFTKIVVRRGLISHSAAKRGRVASDATWLEDIGRH